MSKHIAVFGIYSRGTDLAEGVNQIKLAGFENTDVSMLLPENSGNKDLVCQKNTKAPEGATVGAGAGAVVGGALGWLAGIGMLAIPGLGPFIAAGPIMGALSGLGIGGAVGGIAGGLIGAGIPEYEAKRFKGRIRKGGALLSVHCGRSELAKAKQILENTGAQDISSTGEAKADFGSSDEAQPRSSLSRI